MKANWILNTLGIMLISLSLSAQVVTKDSINSLKHQKEYLEVGKKMNERKLELAKLENELEKKTQEVDKTAEQAQKSANDNGRMADKLTDDAQDKKLANKASKAARDAQRDAKKARKASENLDNLKKDIESLKSKIVDDETKLSSMAANN